MFIRRSHGAKEMNPPVSSPIYWGSLHAHFTRFDEFCFSKSEMCFAVHTQLACRAVRSADTPGNNTLPHQLSFSFRRRSQKSLTFVSSGGGKHPDLSLLLLLLLLMLECLTVAAF